MVPLIRADDEVPVLILLVLCSVDPGSHADLTLLFLDSIGRGLLRDGRFMRSNIGIADERLDEMSDRRGRLRWFVHDTDLRFFSMQAAETSLDLITNAGTGGRVVRRNEWIERLRLRLTPLAEITSFGQGGPCTLW